MNAGQNAPLLLDPETQSVAELSAGGPPVGLFDHAAYEVGTVIVPENGTVVIYTDGIVEARNSAGEEFGLPRLVDACATTERDVNGLVTRITQAVRMWSGDCEQGDDMTLVALATGD